jgi:chemotaxis-related protein WspD
MTDLVGSGAARTADACWQQIGVWGDLSCEKLAEHEHCLHCPVYQERGRSLLDRPADPNYLSEWAQLLALPPDQAGNAPGVLHLVFRVGQSWLALASTCLREVLHLQPVRVVPHRRGKLLLGITAVRGDIHLCVSLHELLHEQRDAVSQAQARFIVAGESAETWVFPVDEVLGLTVVIETALQMPPATMVQSGGAYVRGVFEGSSRSIGILDHELLFRGLQRGVA